MATIRSFFTEKLKLNLSADKTRVVSLEDGFDFLGFRIQRVQLQYGKCVRIRPTQRNLIRLKGKLQAMLGKSARHDDPMVKVAAMNRVLRGWANYYKAVNSSHQFETGDFLAERLFQKWYCHKYQIGVREYLSRVLRNGRVVIRREPAIVELFRMTSNKSMHTRMNHKLVWRYKSIENPYINPKGSITTANTSGSEDNPITEEVPNIQPISPRYNDEIYLSNRILAFERDGWKCTKCGSRENLQAHHIEPIPKGTFDPMLVHQLVNLQTLCEKCHRNA